MIELITSNGDDRILFEKLLCQVMMCLEYRKNARFSLLNTVTLWFVRDH
jgi:hypothetical protein